MSDKIMAGMASIPSRRDALVDAVTSLLPQVDRLGVYLGGYPDIPVLLSDNDKITVMRSQDDPEGDRGDAGKFWWVDDWGGYYLSVDDDIVYPETYVEDTIDAIDYYDRQVAVSCHGVVLTQLPSDTYYGGRWVYHWQQELREDVEVHLACTIAAGFHTEALDLSIEDFPVPQMADIWFAIQCQQQGVPQICRRHPPSKNRRPDHGYLKQNPKVDLDQSIYAQHSNNDDAQTAAINHHHQTHGWKTFGATS